MSTVISHLVSVTDHITEFSIERSVLGNYFSDSLDYNSTILLVWHQSVDASFLDKFPYLKYIVRYGVGYDNIDLQACTDRCITVCNTPDYGVDEVSDTALAMILALARNLKSLDHLSSSQPGSWTGNPLPPNCKRLKNLSVGIIGCGRIGSCLAYKIKSIVSSVSFYDPYVRSGTEKILSLYRHDSLSSLLSSSDIVSVNTDLNDSSSGLINSTFINSMRPSSILINVSRGPLLSDPSAVVSALRSGHLKGFGADVWPSEPPSPHDSYYNSLSTDPLISNKVYITPHTSYYSDDSLIECRSKAALNCMRIINNQEPLNIIS